MMYVTEIEELASFDGLESLDMGLIFFAEDAPNSGQGPG